jgi:hypothetical protein
MFGFIPAAAFGPRRPTWSAIADGRKCRRVDHVVAPDASRWEATGGD